MIEIDENTTAYIGVNDDLKNRTFNGSVSNNQIQDHNYQLGQQPISMSIILP